VEARLSAAQLLDVTRDGLRDIGYRDDLLRRRYQVQNTFVRNGITIRGVARTGGMPDYGLRRWDGFFVLRVDSVDAPTALPQINY
jgi:hypothetical protein